MTEFGSDCETAGYVLSGYEASGYELGFVGGSPDLVDSGFVGGSPALTELGVIGGEPTRDGIGGVPLLITEYTGLVTFGSPDENRNGIPDVYEI